MQKTWKHTVLVDAPVEDVFGLVAGFESHHEWDRFTKKVEQTKTGDAEGLGSEWRVYEQMGLFSLGMPEKDPKFLTGIAKRVVRAVSPNERVEWFTHPIPNIGISAVISYDFLPEGSSTNVTFTSVVSVPGVIEKVGRLILHNLDTRMHTQWQMSVERLKVLAEEQHSQQFATAGSL
jgi:uncharacterized membrane protein